MIVTCERCETRFQLDEARIGRSGTRVRCSRCKHGFVVLPPIVDDDATVNLGAEIETEEVPKPTPPSVIAERPADVASEVTASGAEASEWQFADHHAPVPQRGRPLREEPPADLWQGVLDEEKPPEALDLDSIGSPDSWSFVSEEAPPLHVARATPASAARKPAPRRETTRARVSAPVAAEAAAEAAAPPPSRVVEHGGWALTGLLLLAIVHGIAWRGPAPLPLPPQLALGDGLVAEDLSVRRVENRVAGPLLVVAGAVANRGPSAAGGPGRLVARVIGARAVAQAEAQAPRTPEALREASPGAGLDGRPMLLGAPLAPGERIPFEAVISRPPAGEARLELRLGPPTPATGDPSPREPLPSSG